MESGVEAAEPGQQNEELIEIAENGAATTAEEEQVPGVAEEEQAPGVAEEEQVPGVAKSGAATTAEEEQAPGVAEEELPGVIEKFRRISAWVMGFLIPLLLGGNAILSKRAFDEGMKFSVFLFYKNTLAAIVLMLVAILSRNPRPAMTFHIFLHIMALSILEPVIDQICLYVGLKYARASFSTCMTIIGPALTFFVASICRLEPFNITERSSQAKLLGMTIMVGGALIVALYNGSTITVLQPSSTGSHALVAHKLRENWVRGPILVMVAMVSAVAYNILMKITTNKYPAPLWLTTFICCIGALINMVVATGVEGRSRVSWMILWDIKLACYLYSGLVVSGFTAFLQITLTQMRDPVFVTSFSPISMIFVMVVGAIVLKETIHDGSILGAILIVLGLSLLIWGKKQKPTPPVQGGQI